MHLLQKIPHVSLVREMTLTIQPGVMGEHVVSKKRSKMMSLSGILNCIDEDSKVERRLTRMLIFYLMRVDITEE